MPAYTLLNLSYGLRKENKNESGATTQKKPTAVIKPQKQKPAQQQQQQQQQPRTILTRGHSGASNKTQTNVPPPKPHPATVVSNISSRLFLYIIFLLFLCF